MSDLWSRRYYQNVTERSSGVKFPKMADFLFDRDCSWIKNQDLEHLHIWPFPQYSYTCICQVRFQYYFVFGSYKIFPNFKRSYLKPSIMAREYWGIIVQKGLISVLFVLFYLFVCLLGCFCINIVYIYLKLYIVFLYFSLTFFGNVYLVISFIRYTAIFRQFPRAI